MLGGAALIAACTGKDPYNPGESLGTFTVSTKRLTATCGDQQVPPDPWRFDVRLSRDSDPRNRTVYWIQGGAPVSGVLNAQNKTTMTSTDVRTLREATQQPARAGCYVRREDRLEAAFDATQLQDKLEVRGFSGKLSYKFVAEEGSDCTDVVAAGTFAELPCDVAFELSGAPKSH